LSWDAKGRQQYRSDQMRVGRFCRQYGDSNGAYHYRSGSYPESIKIGFYERFHLVQNQTIVRCFNADSLPNWPMNS
jgi:hypothetical protein